VLREATLLVVEQLPKEAFTGLATKARVTVTTSACWEKSVAEGGTLEAIKDMVFLGSTGVPCQIYDLETGQFERLEYLQNLEPGEYIFWTCLEHVLKTPAAILKEASVVVVNEPGKARTVTKGHAALKIVLDTVNKICAEPLRKGVPSSASGMGKATHGWNFFKDCFKQPLREALFSTQKQREEVYHGHKIMHKWYKNIFVTSTDYKNATDYMEFEFSIIVGDIWMRKCGIPRVLRDIVTKTCFSPRRMVMSATGPLSSIGEPSSDKKREFTTSRGIMMGDPLTKIVLHMTNVISRTIATNFDNASFISRIFPNTCFSVKEKIDLILKTFEDKI
jgi:hypothetical protein